MSMVLTMKTNKRGFLILFRRLIIQTIILTSILLIFTSCLSGSANKDVNVPLDWTEYQLNNKVLSIKIPPSVELRGIDDKYTKCIEDEYTKLLDEKYVNSIPKTLCDPEIVVFQQKGLSLNLKDAHQKYARILIEARTDAIGDYPQRYQKFNFLTKEDVEDIVRRELIPGMVSSNIVYGWEKINGNQCFIITYVRTGYQGAPPVRCKICMLFNNSHYVRIIFSYRENEFKLWMKDFEKSLQTFRWLK